MSLSQQWLAWTPQQEVGACLSEHVKCREHLQDRRWDIKVLVDTGASAWVTRDGPGVTTLSLPESGGGPLVVGGAGYYR